MNRTPAAALLALALAILAASPTCAAAREEFLGAAYPIDVDVSYTAGLFQWIDSIANTSVGKTIPAHQKEYARRWGRLGSDDKALLLKFRRARFAHLAATKSVSALPRIFFAAPNVAAAVAAARPHLSPDEAADLAASLSGLAPKFDLIWDGGSVPRALVRRVAGDGKRGELAAFLEQVAAFYGVDLRTAPRPRLVLVPVPPGWGSHAQAFGEILLVEVQPGEGLAQQAAVIVHENAHFLFDAMPDDRRARLAADVKSLHVSGESVWGLLQEALPTALGQGIADQAFRSSEWSLRNPWYHTAEVDAYAKSLYTATNHALATGKRFDEEFVRHALQIWLDGGRRRGPEILGMDSAPPEPAAAPDPPPTPR